MARADEVLIVSLSLLQCAYHHRGPEHSEALLVTQRRMQSAAACVLCPTAPPKAIIKVREQLRDWDSHKHINNPQIKH